MAYHHRRKNGSVYVYHFDASQDKLIALPRKQTRHLDGLEEKEILEWVRRWENLNNVSTVRPDLIAIPTNWDNEVKKFLQLYEAKGRDRKTLRDHERHIATALPYFIDKKCELWSDFPAVSRGLGPWLKDNCQKSSRRIYAINQSLQLFWKYLDEIGLVQENSILKLTGGLKIIAKKTPLMTALKPEQILEWQGKPELKLFALIGYFFSLRPQETLALTPKDFEAGSKARSKECCKSLSEAGLFDKLAVHIHRQKTASRFKPPKQNSIGWVGCFDKRAAQQIVEIINQKEPNQLLFEFGTDWYFKLWRREGIKGSTPKDLRRASLYHLGHYSDLPIVALRNHARHANIETTMLYTRRPDEFGPGEWQALDLDA